MAVHYLEIVSNDIDTLTGLYQRVHGLSFGPPDPDLGQARVATRADGTLVGIRKPLAAHEQPIMRVTTGLAGDHFHRNHRGPGDQGIGPGGSGQRTRGQGPRRAQEVAVL